MRPGRKEKELETVSGPAAGFAAALREARRQAGSPTYRDMAEGAHYSGPALSQAANGAKVPTWPVTAAYLKACGITDLAPWQNDWHIAKLATKLSKAKGNAANVSYPIHRARTCAVPTVSKDDSPPSPQTQLLDMLRCLGKAKGLSLRATASQMQTCQAALVAKGGPNQTYSSSAIHEVLKGDSPLTAEFVTVYLNAIGATHEEEVHVGEAIGRLNFKLAHCAPVPTVSPDLPAGSVTPPEPDVMVAEPKMARAGRVYVSQRISATVMEDPLADSFLQWQGDDIHPPIHQPMDRPHGSGVRRHRAPCTCCREQGSSETAMGLRQKVARPGFVGAATIFSGLLCWALAFVLEAARDARLSLADLGSALLITTGSVTLVAVLVLLRTVLRDEDRVIDRPARQAGLAKWAQRWRYQPRHSRAPRWSLRVGLLNTYGRTAHAAAVGVFAARSGAIRLSGVAAATAIGISVAVTLVATAGVHAAASEPPPTFTPSPAVVDTGQPGRLPSGGEAVVLDGWAGLRQRLEPPSG